MENDLNVLMAEDEKRKIVLNKQEVLIGKVSFKKVIKLSKILGKIFAKYSNQIKNIQLSNTSNAQDVMQLFELIDEAEIAEIIAVAIDKEIDFCLALSFTDVSNIVATFIEVNADDIEGIVKNFQRITAKVQAIKM